MTLSFSAMGKEKRIIDSWTINAANWINLLDSNGIESRELATNKAIIDAVCNAKVISILDKGYGVGGWHKNSEIGRTYICFGPTLIYII